LNVIFEGRIHAFVFTLSPEPVRGLTLLRSPAPAARARRGAKVGVRRLVEMLDEARVYDVVAGAFPGYQKNITAQEKGFRVPYPLFDVLVDHAWRFEEEDTIVLRCVFTNKTPRTLHYRPDVVAVKVGERTFYCSVADASGEIPAVASAGVLEEEERKLTAELEKPGGGDRGRMRERLREILAAYQRGQAVGYFAITGNPDGTRANLSLKNNFNVLVATGQLP
jgi:hypothetical protein